MFYFSIQLLVLSSIISLSAGETLTEFHVNEILLQQPRTFPCPEAEDIAPCVCIYDSDSSQLTLDCTDISSDDELANVFTKDFPVTDFYMFTMNSSSTLTALNFTCGGVKFRLFDLYPGPFSSLVEVSDIFYESCSNADLEQVTFYDTQLSSLAFPPPPLSEKITDFQMSYSNLASLPAIRSNSLENFYLQSAQISEIIPGTFDEIPNLRTTYMKYNNIKTLNSSTIPITYNGFMYDFENNGLETIEPGAFALTGEPALGSMIFYLRNNQLTTIDGSVFGLLMPYISAIYIRGNPLECGCDIAWIILNPEYLAKVSREGPTCADGTYLTSLDPTTYEDFC